MTVLPASKCSISCENRVRFAPISIQGILIKSRSSWSKKQHFSNRSTDSNGDSSSPKLQGPSWFITQASPTHHLFMTLKLAPACPISSKRSCKLSSPGHQNYVGPCLMILTASASFRALDPHGPTVCSCSLMAMSNWIWFGCLTPMDAKIGGGPLQEPFCCLSQPYYGIPPKKIVTWKLQTHKSP